MKTFSTRVHFHRSAGHVAIVVVLAVVLLAIMAYVTLWTASHKPTPRATIQVKAPARSPIDPWADTNRKTPAVTPPSSTITPPAQPPVVKPTPAPAPVVAATPPPAPVPAPTPAPEGTSVPVLVTDATPATKPAAAIEAPVTSPPRIASADRAPILPPAQEPTKPAADTKKIADAALPWDKAGENVGKTITIEGTIVATRNTGSVCFLDFDKNASDKFYVVIADASLLNSWGQPPEIFFKDKKVRVTGKVTLYQLKRPEMRVLRPDQIEVVEH